MGTKNTRHDSLENGSEITSDKHLTCPLGKAECTISETIQQLNEQIAHLQEQVSTDPLTKLCNVRHLRLTLEQEMERTRRSHQPTTVIMLDVDHFKKFNDTHGHVVGDKVLIHLASLVKNTVRKIDIPCRYGGEEFAIILPSTPILVGIQVAERLRKKIEQQPLLEESNGKTEELTITISAGVDTFTHSHHNTPEEFIDRVDRQLYEAKHKGRNCVHHASEKLTGNAEVTQYEKDALFQQLNEGTSD